MIYKKAACRRQILVRSSVAAVTTLLGLSLSTASDAASRADDLRRGEHAARQHCNHCHAVGRSDKSPTDINRNTAFRDLHRRYPIAMLKVFCRSGHLSGHDEMPAFLMPKTMSRALVAYIDSLQPDGKSRYVSDEMSCR